MIHTTVGVYPNGDYNVNGVEDKHLADHIRYNATFRWGRLLMVDGEVVYWGNLKKEDYVELLDKVSKIKQTKCTAPYI